MSSRLSTQDRERINAGIRDKYNKVAVTPKGHFKYPTGRDGLKGLHYNDQLIADLPDTVADSYCGVGNPFSLGEISSDANVLDIGCGSGVDALLAARLVGASGNVLGIDLTAEMVEKANANKKVMNTGNIDFQVARVQDLTGMEGRFDLVISNGVFNLIPDKDDALKAAYRLLKPGGRLFMADQFLSGAISKDLKERVASWFQWEGGAAPEMEFLAALKKADFVDVERMAETGFNSSPKTRGVLVRARKPQLQKHKSQLPPTDAETHRLSESKHASAPQLVTIGNLIDRAIEMGAEKAKVIDTGSIVVEKWVKWKCIYGCPMYGKDGYHPPTTPAIDEVKEVLGEYSKAILLKGEDGRLLTEVACRLEGEAYHSGYYKAFALTALSAGNGSGPEPGNTWPSGEKETPCESREMEVKKTMIRPMMEACGIDVFETARRNGFRIDTRKETYGRWNFFAMVLIE